MIAWFTNRRLVYGGVVVFAFLLGIGVGTDKNTSGEGQGKESDARARASELEIANHSLETQLEQAEEAAANAMQQAEAEFMERNSELDEREKQLDKRTRNIERTERKVQKLASLGDGIWEVGKDFPGGTYRTQGGDCYWAKLANLNGGLDGIIANHNGPSTVLIDSPWFETTRCGQWKKIG